MDLYTIEQFASYLQSDVDTATAVLLRDLVTGMIEDAGGIVVADETSIPSRIVALALTAAGRAYTNPQGYTSETVGGWTGRRDGAGAAAIGLYFTPDELATVLAAYPSATGTGAAFSITPPFSTAPWSRAAYPLPPVT